MLYFFFFIHGFRETLIWPSFLRCTNGLHIVVYPLHLLWWSFLLIAVLDTDMPWRLCLSCPITVKVFFLHQGKNSAVFHHISSVVFRAFWCSWAHQYILPFLQMFQIVDSATFAFFCYLWWISFKFSSLMINCSIASESSLETLEWQLTITDNNRF